MNNVLKWLLSGNALASFIVALLAVVLWIAFDKFNRKFEDVRTISGGKASVTRLIFSAIRFIILFGAVLIILQINGVNITSMVAGFGIASAIVGLALQDLLKDVIMGMHVLSDGFYGIDDWIEYKGVEGKVVSFTLKSTKIELIDHTVYSISNRNISEVKKLSDMLYFDIPIPYDADGKVVNNALLKAADEIKKQDGIKDFSYKGINEFGESALLHRFWLFCDRSQKYAAKRTALKFIKKNLDDVNVKIPFNQLDVHIDK